MIAVASGKGGVGRSALTAALGILCARQDRRVVLVDMNTGYRCLDMLLGLESRISFDLGDVVAGACGLDRALVQDRRSGVWLLAASQFRPEEAIWARTLPILLEVLRTQNACVLLDLPVGAGPEYALAAELADQTLLLTTPDDVSLRNAERVSAAHRAQGRANLSLVISRISPGYVESGRHYTPEVCAQTLDIPVLGVVPEDGAFERQVLERDIVLGGGPAASGIGNLLARLEDASVPLWAWKPQPPPAPAEAIEEEKAPQKRGVFARFR